ncbi:MAG: cell division protein FtsA [Rickettsiales bacterium]|nr:cell division protein FtsA [Rickettsiales bacterium]|tara:strand:- start:8936 stop:10153 length:1218 start_codon:yes stop_codon:yes gene_type:complete
MTSPEKLSKYIQAVLDIGAHKITCLIGTYDSFSKKLLIKSIYQTASRGMAKGKVVSADDLEASILKCVSQTEQQYGEPIKSVAINVANIDVLSEWTQVRQSLSGRIIDETHLVRLRDIEDTLPSERDFDLIYAKELTLTVDKKTVEGSPIGLSGQVLSAVFHVMTAKRDFLRSIRTVVRRCHLKIDGFYFAGMSAGFGCSSYDERVQGVTVLDIGADQTCVAMFHKGKFVYGSVIPVGGKHITRDIAQAFKLSIQDAERVKNLYGSLVASPADRAERIYLPGNGNLTITKADLIEVIFYRAQEIFMMAKQKVQGQRLEATAGCRYIITGGSCQLPGMRELGNRLLEKPVRIGRPLAVAGAESYMQDPGVTGAVGLLYASLLDYKTGSRQNKKWHQRIGAWIKENL